MRVSQQLRGFAGRICDQLALELIAEGIPKDRQHVGNRDVRVQLLGDTGDALALDAARHNVFEPREIGVAVEREAVRGDVTAAVNADGTDLAIVDPDAGVRRRFRPDTKLGAHADHHALHLAHVPSHAGAKLLQIQHRIGDQLAGAMESDQTAAIRPPEFRAETPQLSLVLQGVSFATNSHRIHRIMFQQH